MHETESTQFKRTFEEDKEDWEFIRRPYQHFYDSEYDNSSGILSKFHQQIDEEQIEFFAQSEYVDHFENPYLESERYFSDEEMDRYAFLHQWNIQ